MTQVETPDFWRPLVVPAIIVIVGLLIAWALFAHYGRTKPNASGTILKQVVYPVQVESADAAPEPGMAGAVDQPQETIVLVQARITNVSRKPVSVFDIVQDIKLNGTVNQSFAANPEEIDRLFQRFPDLAGMRMPLLARHQVIDPGQSAEGLMVFSYPWSQDQWNQGKDEHVVVSFQTGPALTIPVR
jgi:hypothetical protein